MVLLNSYGSLAGNGALPITGSLFMLLTKIFIALLAKSTVKQNDEHWPIAG